MKTELIDAFKNNRLAILFIGIMVGVFVLISPLQSSTGEETLPKDNYLTLSEYTESTEKRLENTLSQIAGAGETKVMISFESSFESVYASDARLEEGKPSEAMSRTTEKQLVLMNDRSYGESPVLLKELCPRAKGVVVVCQGAADPMVEKKIKEAVSALLSVSETKISVSVGRS